MKFFVFATLLFAAGLFHRREHVRFIEELGRLQKKLAAVPPPDAAKLKDALKGEDWRFISLEGTQLGLRRAFEAKTPDAILRYAAPVVLASVALLALESWGIAGFYIAAMAVKWFVTLTVVNVDTLKPGYEVRLLGIRLFGESLSETDKMT